MRSRSSASAATGARNHGCTFEPIHADDASDRIAASLRRLKALEDERRGRGCRFF